MNNLSQNIVGVDEVGRGCLFGPVFAGAVSLSKPAEDKLIASGLKDSKQLTAKKRALLSPLIKEKAHTWGIGEASNKEIDLLGIRTATELAVVRALNKISIPIEILLVDGILPIRIWSGEQKTLIKGDCNCACISAASVIAKEARDSLLKKISKNFPGYELESNFGYGTKAHRDALRKLGITKLHRETFLSKIINN